MKNKLLFLSLYIACVLLSKTTVYAQTFCPVSAATNPVCHSGTTTASTSGSSSGSESWSSTTTTVATVAYTGGTGTCTIYGVAAGTTTIKYTSGTGSNCQFILTVDPTPSTPTISGGTSVCIGSIVSLTGSPTGGTWSSSDYTIATVGSSVGDVTGEGVGSATISYTVTNSCGSRTKISTMVVNDLPDPSISGTLEFCQGTTVTLTGATTGGTWSSSTTTVATADISSGVVTGVSAGTSDIVYTVTDINGCTNVGDVFVTVDAAPALTSPITGIAAICGSGTSTLSNSTTGGVWSSSDNLIATVDVMAGVVTTVNTGTATISYTVTNGTCNTSVTAVFSVNPLPSIGTISSSTMSSQLCVGSYLTLSDVVTGGTWISSDPTIATIGSSSGIVGGVSSSGPVVMTYTTTNGVTGCINTATLGIIVNPLPTVSTITGTFTVCETQTTSLSDASGYPFVWSSDNTTIATVDGSGNVTGVSTGTATISFTVMNGYSCSASAIQVVTVNLTPAPGTLSGPTAVCYTNYITLSDAVTGGTWSSSDVTLATVGTGALAGYVYGADGSAGVVTISYTVTQASCSASVTTPITVDVLPNAGTISGSSYAVCVGSTIILSSSGDPSGTWSSSNLSTASIFPSLGDGIVVGISSGTANISYSVTNSCGNATPATQVVTVNPVPDAGTISGTNYIDLFTLTTTTSLSSSGTSGGTWTSSTTTIATVDASTGIVYGVSGGTTTISYTVTNAYTCSSTATYIVLVNTLCDISGPTSLCAPGVFEGPNTIYLTSSIPTSGDWVSSDPSIASVNWGGGASAWVESASPGTVIISLTYMGATSYYVITVNPLPYVDPSAPTGAATINVPGVSYYYYGSSDPGGTWVLISSGYGTLYTAATAEPLGVQAVTSGGGVDIYYVAINMYGCQEMTNQYSISIAP